jgi:hypothetical protein
MTIQTTIDRHEFAALLRANGNNLRKIKLDELEPDFEGDFDCGLEEIKTPSWLSKLALWHPVLLLVGIYLALQFYF